mgnify:CR=1 FL=1
MDFQTKLHDRIFQFWCLLLNFNIAYESLVSVFQNSTKSDMM